MGDAPGLRPPYTGKHPEHLVVSLGESNHGAVSRRQLLSSGLTRHQIDGMLASGLLVAQHRGVFSVGRRRLTERGRWSAAVLAAGEAAVLSHRSAARLWGLRVGKKTIEVTAPRDRRREGLKIYVAELPPDETTVRDGIPLTTVARTLRDLAAVEPPDKLERALHEAERLQLADATPLAALLDRYPRRPGSPALRRIVREHDLGEDVTESDLEDAFRVFLDQHDLPRPMLNRWLTIGSDRIRADALYPEQRLIIELDGRDHAATKAFEADRRRDRRLAVCGWQVIRITWRELHRNRAALAADLRALLARR